MKTKFTIDRPFMEWIRTTEGRPVLIALIVVVVLFVGAIVKLAWSATISPLLQAPKSVLIGGYDVNANQIQAVAVSSAGVGSGAAGQLGAMLYVRDSEGNNQEVAAGDQMSVNGSNGITIAVTPYVTDSGGIGYLSRAIDAGNSTDDVTIGLPAMGEYVYDPIGGNWDKARAASVTGANINGTAPASVPHFFDTAGANFHVAWNAQSTDDANNGAKMAPSGLMGWNGASWDRLRSTIANGLDVDVTRAVWSTAFSNITTNVSVLIKSTPGVLNRVNVNVAGTASNVRFYDDSTLPCDTFFVLQLDTTALNSNASAINHLFNNGICMITVGTTPADISILYQ